MTILFIADLHLHDSRPETTQGFYQFLRERARGVAALYILGDFFDVWIGDDDDAPLVSEAARELRTLSDQGTDIFLMHGNRDFLLGNDFARRAGASMLDEGTVIDLYGCPTLLLHGDSLCTGDAEYQAFRQQVRSSAWQTPFLAQPLEARRAIAAKIRAESQNVNSMKAESIMDVTEAEVVRVMEEAGVTRLIHGHTHRPARHPLTINGAPAERIVLGDWHDYGWCIEADAHSVDLKRWEL
jgi:UDP-2,3-diacylglucosamine hydrolase